MKVSSKVVPLGLIALCLTACTSGKTVVGGNTYVTPSEPNTNGNTTVTPDTGTGPTGAAIVTMGQLALCMRPDSNNAARIEMCQLPQDQQFTFIRGQIRNAAGQCLDLLNANTQPGAPAVFTACATDFTAPSQLWTFANNYIYFTSKASPSMCLASNTGALDLGSGLQLEVCTTSSLKWTFGPQGVQLSNDSNQCLTPVADSNGALAPQLQACVSGDANQLWSLGGPTVQSVQPTHDSNTCLTLPQANNAVGTAATLAPCDNTNGQAWMVNGFDGSLRLQPSISTCLDGNAMASCDGNSRWNIGLVP